MMPLPPRTVEENPQQNPPPRPEPEGLPLILRSEMAKCNRESDSDDIPTTSSHSTVFIDTTLDTHLAMIFSDADTVFDLKKKIMSQHPQCFPNFGEIKIRSLKVKRKRYFYHLSDSMLVKSAFEGAKKSWFLSVDASSLQQGGDNQFSSNPDDSKKLALICITETPSDDRNNHLPDSPLKRSSLLDTQMFPQPGDIQYMNQNFLSADQSGPGFSCKEVSKGLEMEVRHVIDDSCKKLSSDSQCRSDFEMEKYDLQIKGNKIPKTNIEHRDGNSKVELDYFQGNKSPEGSLRTGPASKTKYRSKKKSDDAVSNCTVKDNNDSIGASGMYTSHLAIVHPEFSSGTPGKEVLNEVEMVSSDVGKEPCETSFPDTNIRSDSGEIPGTHVECKKDKSRNMSGDAHCNDSLVEASKSRPAEKKKRKRERKRESKGAGNPSEEPETLLSNLSEETPKAKAIIPENSKENKLKPTTATSDSLFIEPPEDVQLVASPSSGKKKRKMKNKLPRDQVLAAEPSSLYHVGEESFKENGEFVAKDSDRASVAAVVSEQNIQHATLSGTFEVSQKQKHHEPVQEVVERNKLPSSLLGIDASGLNAANDKGKSDAPEPRAGSGSKRRKKPKKHHSTNVKEFTLFAVNEFNNLKRDFTDSGQDNTVPDDHKIETSHPDKIEEQRELPQTRDPEAMLSDNCKILIQGEAGVSANLLEPNLVMESGQSAGRRVKTRAKKSVATKQIMSSKEHADNSVIGISSPVPHFNDHSSGVAKKEESILSRTKRKNISIPKTVDTTFVGANGEADEMSGNEAESLPFNQVNKTQETAENIEGNLGKKAKKNKTSDAKSFAGFPVKEQANEVVSFQLNQINMTPKNTENMDEKSRKKTKKNQNSAANSLLPINEQEVGGEELASSNDRLRDVDAPSKTKRKTKFIETSSKNQLTGRHPQQTLRTVDLTQVPSSDTLEGNSIGRPLQCDVDRCNMIDANYHTEVSECDEDRINFKDYFVMGEHKHEVLPIQLVVDKVSEAKRSDREVKSKKNAIKLVVPSSATSPDLQNSLRSYVNQASERRSHGLKAPGSQDTEEIKTIPHESKHIDPKENRESLDPTHPSSDSCDKYLQKQKETKRQSSLGRHHVMVSKASNKKIGEVVNSSRHEKSLLATPGAIFRDGSSDSSEDENGDVNSDSSTKAPSDNSSSSGYAEGESKSSLESPGNGIHGVKEKDGGESIIKSRASVLKNITMDMILRGSSRFKKAKLTATQSQLEDTESQPVDFVPDSQANL